MKRRALILSWFCVLLTGLLQGCAGSLKPHEPPAVEVSYIRLLPSRGLAPEFEIGLHIVNPNAQRLALKGISYTVHIEGHQVLIGVSNKLSELEGFSEGDAVLQTRADVLSGIRLLTDLLNGPRDTLNYEFNARLNVGGFAREIEVVRKGEIKLPSRGKNRKTS
jgi:LEA14-like dessication related protein